MIIQETNYRQAAKKKLGEGFKDIGGQREQAMKTEVRNALENFIEQDNEFAQAVVQGGSFADCMKEVARGVGAFISDIDAYKRAVRFYFSGADINVSMNIQLNPYENESQDLQSTEKSEKSAETPQKRKSLSLSLDDLF